MGVNDTSDTDALDWRGILAQIPPAETEAANWSTIYTQLQQSAGTTWGQYIAMLDHYATLLPTSLGDPSNPADLLQLAINQATAAVSTSISGTAVATGPGVVLAGNTITATNSTTGDVFTASILGDGSFVFPTVTAGSYTFTVAGAVIDGNPPPVTVNAGQAVAGVTVLLDAEATLSGVVTAADTGAPVADASVFIFSGGQFVDVATTDTSGDYSDTCAAGSYTLMIAAPGLARVYSNVTLAAGFSVLNFALANESAATGTVTLSDGQPVQNLEVIAVLHGSEPFPYFADTFTSGDFSLGALAPGVYDVTVFSPGYNADTISGVSIGPGQTLDLGAIQLEPPDPVNPALQGLKDAAEAIISGMFSGSGKDGQAIYNEYFNGTGPNQGLQITDPKDVQQFIDNPQTTNALENTLAQIVQRIQNLPEVQQAIQNLQNCNAPKATLKFYVTQLMPALGLGNWMNVTQDPTAPYGQSPPDALQTWEYQNGHLPSTIAGGVGYGPGPTGVTIYDSRMLSGTVTLNITPDGTLTISANFHVDIHDRFAFHLGTAGLGPIAHGEQSLKSYVVAAGVLGLGVLERAGLTYSVPFEVQFDKQVNLGPVHRPTPDQQNCDKPKPQKSSPYNPNAEQGHDPNALLGPVGVGAQNLIQPNVALPYTIDFENDGTAATQTVTVTEQLDSSLDWSTFQLASFGFGSLSAAVPAGLTQYQTTIAYQNADGSALDVQVSLDFNVQSGVLTGTLTSLDPSTGEAPNGVYDGFLPPDDATHVGEGFAQYTVAADANLATGTLIAQQASVDFDTNAPLATNTVVNPVAAVVNQTTFTEPAGTTTPTAEKISTLLGSHYSDPDGTKITKPGIAIIGLTGTGGAWQYSTDGRSWISIAAVDLTSALLLPQADRLRFLPSGLGTEPASLIYVAWDGSTGKAGQYVNIASTGGATSFSANAGMLTVNLTAVTQAPVWLATGVTLAPVLPGPNANPTGQTVAQAFAAVFSGDSGQTPGIAVLGATGTRNGAWEYNLYDTATQTYAGWQKLAVSASAALLLSGQDLITFVPNNSTFTGTANLTVRAWDQSTGTDGAVINLSKSTSTGGTTAFSRKALTATIHVNTAPTQTAGNVTLSSIQENVASAAVTVATLLQAVDATDADAGAALGMAITAATGPGTWQYQLAGGGWRAVPAALALLLPPSAMLRFMPAPDASGSAVLTWVAWDQTDGRVKASNFAIPGTGGAFAFSMASATATVTITSSHQAPEWSGSGAALTPVLPGTYSLTGAAPPGDTVQAVFGPYFQDGANPASPGIAVTALTGTSNGTWQYSANGTTWTSIGSVSLTKRCCCRPAIAFA